MNQIAELHVNHFHRALRAIRMNQIVELHVDRFHRALRAILPFASTDKARPHLNGVLVETCPDRPHNLRLVATDGHTLARVDVECSEVGRPARELLCVDDAKKLLAATKHTKALGGTHVTLTHTHVEWCHAQTPWYPVCQETWKFPPYEQVIPKPKLNRAGEPVGMNADYVARVGKCARVLFGADAPVAFQFGPWGHPVVATLRRDPFELLCVVMPVRL